jgi:hypothetical protein
MQHQLHYGCNGHTLGRVMSLLVVGVQFATRAMGCCMAGEWVLHIHPRALLGPTQRAYEGPGSLPKPSVLGRPLRPPHSVIPA